MRPVPALAAAIYVASVTFAVASPEVATCSSPAAEIVPAAWEDRNQLLSRPETQPDDIPVPRFSAGGREQIDRLRNNTIFVSEDGPLQNLDAVRWDDESQGKYYSTQLHGLVGLGSAFDQGKKLPPEVEQAIGDHIRNWAYCAAHNPDISARAWYEGTVVKRQSNLLRALQYMRQGGELGSLSFEELLFFIDANADYLLDTENVYSFGNHGIRQDMLLASTALMLPQHPRADEMLRTAERRLDEAAVELFTEEGIWKEHAPGYVNYALRLLTEVRALDQVSDRFNPERLLGRIDSSLEYLTAVLLPDGQIPYVGSSSADLAYSGIRGIEAELPSRARSLAAFPDYGHAIVRGDHPNGLYLLFVASQNLPAGKRHADDLSFLLYNFERPWITEGGHQTYEINGMSRYLKSAFAHNTYTLNGDYVREDMQPELKTELTRAEQTGGKIVLEGFTERLVDDGRFERRIEVTDYSRLTIADTLRGKGKWEGRFQLPGDLTVKTAGNVVTAADKSGRTMTLAFSSDQPLSFSTCHGQENPICGWAKPSHEFGPATTLMWAFEDDAIVSISVTWSAPRP
jgi:hypothetical protein